ncbi:MAG: MAC/perforin domain-containing protein [Pseudomonadota bacterium]
MTKTQIAIVIGGIALAGTGGFAASQYWDVTSSESEPIALAPALDEVAQEASATECGLSNGTLSINENGYLSDAAIRARVYLSEPLTADDDAATMIEQGNCRYSLTGLWTEDLIIANDFGQALSEEQFIAKMAESQKDAMVSAVVFAEGPADTSDDGLFEGLSGADPEPLTNASFVNPNHIKILASDDGETLTISDAIEAGDTITAVSNDGVALAGAMVPLGERKTYKIDLSGEEKLLFLDVLSTGRVRLQIDGVNFFRPRADAMQVANERIDDAWMIDRNLDNLGASMRGYDVVNQDPMKLNVNESGLGEIFKRAAPTEYSVVEKRTVPLGLKLVPHGEGGSVTGSRLIGSSSQFQQTIALNMGRSVGVGLKGAGASAGAKFAYDRTTGMRSETESRYSWGYARHKEYSLVQDQPYSRLSDEFVEAVFAAQRFGEYDALIKKFGTHYPYAVTYGAGLVMWNEYSSQTLANWQAQGFSIDVKAKAGMKGLEVGATQGAEFRTEEQTEAINARENGNTETVGGDGSFTMDGFRTGKPYPIMADLRPLHLLLSPLNFPGNPEIYGEARERLQSAIDAYLAANQLPLTDEVPALPTSNLPGKKRQVVVTPGDIWCSTYKKGIGLERHIEVVGYLDFELRDRRNRLIKEEKIGNWNWKSRIKLDCFSGKGGRKAYSRGKSLSMTLSDEQLNGASLIIRGSLKEGNWEGKRSNIDTGNNERLMIAKWGLSDGNTSAKRLDDKRNKNHVYLDAKIEITG